MFDTYAWSGGRELRLRLGDRDWPTVLIAPGLFEEANRTRAFTVAVMRHLAAAGIASILPDLPGTNESLVPTADARLADWRAAFAAARPGGCRHAVTIRGGALVATTSIAWHLYQLSPISGATVVRDLRRTRLAAGGKDHGSEDGGPTVELAGNLIARAMLGELEAATVPAPARVARLVTEPDGSDARFSGRPLWRASEPDTDDRLAEALAADIGAWVRSSDG